MKIGDMRQTFGNVGKDKVKGTPSFTGASNRKASRSKLLRKINGQLLRDPDTGKVMDCQVSYWRSSSGLTYYTAREVVEVFDEEQCCYFKKCVGDKFEVKSYTSLVWDIVKDGEHHTSGGHDTTAESPF